ncbi:CmpA/NrtA family ABC transporter substrate-binding protein [Pseudomonas asuensis]|uniref:Nitrate transporter n=1 Tax=Pseudomonas asuensis TaxID=1825787 RepID=A0ABQ2GR09_9PSED|nr:CmpA/NrtA family ABC transporter substrate-binding protein [Pseudomonas asuensis]GGM07250.1 nitrate transporter [Pseudomonas asuensis]
MITNNALAWVSGSDAPERSIVNLGFMPLTDSASLIVAATQGFAQPYGLTLHLHRQPSWSALRDNLLTGELDAAHSLYSMIYGLQLGLGGPSPTDMAVLMGLAQNGQSINLSAALAAEGINTAEALAQCIQQPTQPPLMLAHTLPTGTHALWLYYWLAAKGIHPLEDVTTAVVPPPLMVEHLRAGRIDGYCVGEPWGALAIEHGLGVTLATTQAIWPDHPEKVLACTREFAEQNPNTARALICALLEASRFIEESVENRRSTAQLISGSAYVNAPVTAIEPRMLGHYTNGLGEQWQDEHPLRFFHNGAVNMPYLSDGMWFMTQFRRWGLLRNDPDYLGIARQVQQLSLYAEAAERSGVQIPEQTMRSATLLDGRVWDGQDPAGYARSFPLHALADAMLHPLT